ncbi:MAG TPA: DUF5695 domain-containing protein, partial [Gemmatimonadaceae bacterium]
MDNETPSRRTSHAANADDSSPLTRRRFLQAASIVGAGLAIAPNASAQAASRDESTRSPQPHSGPPGSSFAVQLDAGAIVSLQYARDTVNTEYIAPRGRLGDAVVRYRPAGRNSAWQTAETGALAGVRNVIRSADGAHYEATYEVAHGATPALAIQSRFTFEDRAILWTITVRNRTHHPLEIGDLALPLPMTSAHSHAKSEPASVLKHSFISGHGSFLFWMRSNSAGPFLTMTPLEHTSLEYWDAERGDYRVYVHSAAAGAVAREHGCHWRQPNTSITLAPAGSSRDAVTYGVKLQWADGYDAVRPLLVDEGLIDVHVVPGMTVPSDLSARIALRATQHIEGVDAEFPLQTTITPLGRTGGMHLYEVRFAKLGENRLTVRFGKGRHIYLEFFSTEPLETLMTKRAAFVAAH